MTRNFQVSHGDFESLLRWLDPDREKAGQKYEFIRARLIRIFYARQCPAAEELTDLTIERVTAKVKTLAAGYQGEPALYFYAVAKNVFLEYSRKPKLEQLPDSVIKEKTDENLENYYDCLDKCLTKLPPDQHRLIIDYYQGDKQAKIERRKTLAELSNVSAETLRVRALRIRITIQKCVLTCVRENC
jgi:RNA polymerase sigma factor (sigma-70 family)